MDSSKHESSSYENYKKEKINFENSEAPRSYDCTFCKRGFTNAQALGGHMNIHRKEKAKAKKLSESTVNAHKSCEYFTPISDEQAQYYGSLRENKSYQMFSSPPNPSPPHAYPQMVSHPELFTPYGEFMGSNLNLRIGLPLREEEKEEIKREEGERNRLVNEVDLELRLGQNP